MVVEFVCIVSYNESSGLGQNAKTKNAGRAEEVSIKSVSIKEEMRANLLRKLAGGEAIFPGIIGFEDTVTPQIVNAILSKHNFILLGLRGQAKSRILRSLVSLLDPAVPIVAGCEINDDPFIPFAGLPRTPARNGRFDTRRLP